MNAPSAKVLHPVIMIEEYIEQWLVSIETGTQFTITNPAFITVTGWYVMPAALQARIRRNQTVVIIGESDVNI
jgi:hypothetical protein